MQRTKVSGSYLVPVLKDSTLKAIPSAAFYNTAKEEWDSHDEQHQYTRPINCDETRYSEAWSLKHCN